MSEASHHNLHEATICIEFVVPDVWPPPHSTLAFEGILDGRHVRVTAEPAGCFKMAAESGGGKLTYITPHLKLPDYAFIKLAIAWDGAGNVGCAINGCLVSEETAQPVALCAASHPPTHFRTPVSVAIPPNCSDVERSLLRLVLDLQFRVSTRDRFDLLEASAILRRLLLDARPIVHLANRKYRVRLRFPLVAAYEHFTDSDRAAFEFVNLCPDYADGAEIQQRSLEQFLATAVLRDEARQYSVSDVIDVCANVKGGIHFGEAGRDESRSSLLQLDERFYPSFVDASLATLPGVAWSTARAVRPLLNAILNAG